MNDIDISKAAFYIRRQVGKKKRKKKETKKKNKTKQKPKGKCNQVGAMIFHPYRENRNIVVEQVQKPFKGYGLNEVKALWSWIS